MIFVEYDFVTVLPPAVVVSVSFSSFPTVVFPAMVFGTVTRQAATSVSCTTRAAIRFVPSVAVQVHFGPQSARAIVRAEEERRRTACRAAPPFVTATTGDDEQTERLRRRGGRPVRVAVRRTVPRNHLFARDVLA